MADCGSSCWWHLGRKGPRATFFVPSSAGRTPPPSAPCRAPRHSPSIHTQTLTQTRVPATKPVVAGGGQPQLSISKSVPAPRRVEFYAVIIKHWGVGGGGEGFRAPYDERRKEGAVTLQSHGEPPRPSESENCKLPSASCTCPVATETGAPRFRCQEPSQTQAAGEREAEQQERGGAGVEGPRSVAIHFGILARAHLHPEVCDIRHGRFP